MALAERAAAQEADQSILPEPVRRDRRRRLSTPSRTWALGPRTRVTAPIGSPLEAALDVVFGAMAVAGDPTGGAVDLDLAPCNDRSLASWRLALSGVPIAQIASPDALAPMLEGALVGLAVHTRRDAAAFHAAAIGTSGSGAALVLAPRGGGKSTLSALVAGRGASYLGDEVAFVRFDDLALAPFPKAASLKERSFALFPTSPAHHDLSRGRIRYHLPATTPRPAPEAVPITRLFMARFDPELPRVSVRRLTPEQAAIALVEQCFEGLERAPRTIEVVARLSAIPALELAYGDPVRAAHVVEEEIGR